MPELVSAATALQEVFRAADAPAAAKLMHSDVVLEDRSLRTQVIGRIEATRYLGRVLGDVPYGRRSQLRHVVGGRRGGGFEWTAAPEADMLVGITALELDADGLITRVTALYDSRQVEPGRKAALVAASLALSSALLNPGGTALPASRFPGSGDWQDGSVRAKCSGVQATRLARRSSELGIDAWGLWRMRVLGRRESGEDALMTRLVGKGSRHGSTWFDRVGDITKRPPVWMGIATGLALTGPKGRRAAVRGSASYVAGAVAHLAAKVVVHRGRPPGASRHTSIGPVTSSFPSGHCASELAFSLGAAQEIPWLFVPLYGATLAGEWSLVRSRAHYPSDIFAGAAIAIAVALVASRWWPSHRASHKHHETFVEGP